MADIRVKINVFLLFFYIKKHEYFFKNYKKRQFPNQGTACVSLLLYFQELVIN